MKQKEGQEATSEIGGEMDAEIPKAEEEKDRNKDKDMEQD